MYLLLVGEGLPAAFTVALDLVERPPWGGFEWQGGLRGAQRSAGHFVGLSREQTIIRKAGGLIAWADRMKATSSSMPWTVSLSSICPSLPPSLSLPSELRGYCSILQRNILFQVEPRIVALT